ncbi:MAG: TonB-dependent receptor plug [Segetibacter sp.]|nr:TonB-dependent receptor plug [Segetibacter sp.]
MRRYIFLILTLIVSTSFCQDLFQTIRGIVIDKDSRRLLEGATVSIAGKERKLNAVSDSNGRFIINNVAIGRTKIESSYAGYQVYATDNIIVSVAKQPELILEMEESSNKAQTALVKTTRNPKMPVNRYAIVSGRSFSPEETQRFAASANDPSRMALGFPGVQATRDTRSDIIIRGNNPVGMQWRLEGIDIPNPNHFARRGSSGGGITIFSLSMLDNSDFLTGAMPAEYGDVLSGVFDMHFRKGNNQRTENTFKAGLIGLDFSAEGPIKKGRSSYLVNYRYSTLGLLKAIGLNLVGERESNTFQDVSFNLAFANKKNSVQWNFWGIGGYSKEYTEEVEDTLEWKQYDDYAVYDFITGMGAIGLGNTYTLNNRSFIKTSVVLTSQQISFIDDTLSVKKQPYTVNDELYNNSRLSFTTSYNNKFSAAVNMKAGVFINRIQYALRQDKFNYITHTNINTIDGNGNTWLLQPYWQMSFKPGSSFTINPGVHVMHLALNKQTVVDPRLSVQYRFNAKQTFSLAYGLHSKILPLGSYFYKSNAASAYPNKDLAVMRAHHYIAAFDRFLGKGWRIHAEGYYQQLFKIPVVNDVNRTYWILNELDGYANEPLVSKGKGTNKGIDLTLEKVFTKGLFMITSFSVFNSTYNPLNEISYDTRFNSNTSGSWTGAKEWSMKRNKVFQLGWKIVYNGGLPLTPLANVTSSTREPLLDETRPYSEKVPAYFRTDGRIAVRKDKTKVAWQLALDIQNIFGIENTDGLSRKYDPSANQWVYKKQSGLVPVLSYQVDF